MRLAILPGGVQLLKDRLLYTIFLRASVVLIFLRNSSMTKTNNSNMLRVLPYLTRDRFHDNYWPNTIPIGQDVLESATTLFKLAAPSLSSCALSIYFSQFYLCYCFSSYPLPVLTMHHIPLCKMWRSLKVYFPAWHTKCEGYLVFIRADPTQIIAHAHWSQ